MSDFINVSEIFGENVFNDAVMQERLPKKVYKKLKEVIQEDREMDLETADVVAHEMKERGDPLHPLVPTADRRDRRKT